MFRRSILALPFVLCGCNTGGIIQSVALAPGQIPTLGQPVDVVVRGSGTCTILNINWGDEGASRYDSFNNVDLTAGAHFTHTYSGWPGGRTITVKPQYQCAGTAQTRFVTNPETASLAWARDPNGARAACVEFPGKPALPDNVTVRISAPPTPIVNFGCPFDGCKYDTDGRPGSSASSPFGFPGFREYSLVLRLGQDGQQFQGGKAAAPFMVASASTLFFCQNTDRPDANINGGWQVDVRVDELGFTNFGP